MTVLLLAAEQMLILLFIAIIGFFLRRKEKLRDAEQAFITLIFTHIALPALILHSFQANAKNAEEVNLLLCGGIYLLILLVSVGIGYLAGLAVRLPKKKMGVWLFGHMFTNGGNLGMIVITALYSGPIVIYAALLMFLANILMVFLGMGIMNHYGQSEKTDRRGKSLLLFPPVLAGILGLVLLLLRIQLPSICIKALDTLKNLTAPLAMITVGSNLAKANIQSIVGNGKMYLYSVLRLIVLPLIVFLLLRQLEVQRELMVSLVFVTAMPCATNTAMYAQECNNDAVFASQMVFLSTLLSVATIPLVAMVFG